MRTRTILNISIGLAMFTLIVSSLGLGMIKHGNMAMCPLAAVMGANCSDTTSHESMVLHHLSSLKQMSTATLTGGLIAFAFMSLFFVAFLRFSSRILQIKISKECYYRRERWRHTTSSPIRHGLFWSALHNKFGSIIPHRMREFAAMP